MWAVEGGRADEARLLLQHNARVDLRTNVSIILMYISVIYV